MQQKSVKFANDFLNNYSHYKLDFINDFYGIEPIDKDLEDFKNFFKVMQLKAKALSLKIISKKTGLSKSSIGKWVFNISIPPIIQLLNYHNKLTKKCNKKWLSINSTRGGKLIGQWIAVPETIDNYQTIVNFLEQIKPLQIAYERAKKFKINLEKQRTLLFAYLLGIMLGDASKHGIKRRNRTSRRVQLALTGAHKSNERIGNFTSLCANSIGLRMNRIKDMPAGKMNIKPFYRWSSQSSLLVQWIFDVCMGLNNDQTTTYDNVKMGWLLKMPKQFKIWFLQGLADSDGYVDFNSFQVGIISQPNTDLIKKIIESFGVKCSIKIFRENNLEAVIVSVEDAYKLQLFNPIVKSYRYFEMQRLATAKKLSWHMSEDLNLKIVELLQSGLDGTKLIRKLIQAENIRVRPNVIRRIKRVNKIE